MRYARLLLLLCPLLQSCVDEALAVPPLNETNAEQYTRVGTGFWGRQWDATATSGTATLVLNTPGDTTYAIGDIKCVEWGTTIRSSCVSQAYVAFVMDTGITIAASGLVTDGGTTGANNVERVEAGTYLEKTLYRALFFQGRVGRRTGFCTGTSNSTDFWPCDADADCTGGACRGESNGSCIESSVNYCNSGASPFDMIKCAFVQNISDSGTADCYHAEIR